MRIDREDFIHWHGEHFGVATGFIDHLEHTNRAASHNHTRDQRKRRDDQHVNRIAIVGDGVGHITVVTRVMHGRAHKAIHENRAGFFVDFVFDRISVHRDFDNDIEIVRQVAPTRYFIEAHGCSRFFLQITK